MRQRVFLLVTAALALASVCQAAKLPVGLEQEAPAMVAAARQAVMAEKAVPRKDKITVDIVGVLADEAVYSGDACGYEQGDFLALFLRVKGQWISAFCHPSALNSCLALRVGQRVRVQGVLIAAPDVLDPGFDPCDQGTWFIGPINFLFATKVSK